MRTLLEARDDKLLGQLHRRLSRVDLLILDELGFVPFDRAGGELLFNLLSERHERRSTLVTTNLAFSEWVCVFVDEKLTTALRETTEVRLAGPPGRFAAEDPRAGELRVSSPRRGRRAPCR